MPGAHSLFPHMVVTHPYLAALNLLRTSGRSSARLLIINQEFS